eukprot:8742252-Prorocentrum_lima.AAC.1
MPAPKSACGVVGTDCCTGSTSGRTSSMRQGGCDGAGMFVNHIIVIGAMGILLRPSGECAVYNTRGDAP